MSNKLSVIDAPELAQIEKSKAESIMSAFAPISAEIQTMNDRYVDIMGKKEDGITEELVSEARRLRLDMRPIRTKTGRIKDGQKEAAKLFGNAVMGVHNLLVLEITEREDNCKAIEKHFEIEEQKKLTALQAERVELLSQYVEDAQDRDLSGMDVDVWEAYLGTKRQQHEDRIAAERKAEEDRIAKEKAEQEERERIAAENEKLKAEAAERERLAKVEAEKLAKAEAARKKKEAAEKKKRDDAERKQREEYEAKLKAEREEAQRKADIERKKREAGEAKARAERERLAEEQRIEREKREKLEAEIAAKEAAKQAEKEEAARRLQDAKVQQNNRDEMLMAIAEMKREQVVEAIIAGKIPHVKYTG